MQLHVFVQDGEMLWWHVHAKLLVRRVMQPCAAAALAGGPHRGHPPGAQPGKSGCDEYILMAVCPLARVLQARAAAVPASACFRLDALKAFPKLLKGVLR